MKQKETSKLRKNKLNFHGLSSTKTKSQCHRDASAPVQFTIFLRFKLLVNDEEENFWSISNSTVSIYEKSKSLILDVLVL